MGSLRGHKLTPEDRFWARVETGDGCWLWQGALDGKGYGQMMWDGKPGRTHRWAYEHFVGPIPEGMTIDHMCGVPRCVRPDHLRAVTLQQNILAHHREQTQTCRQGHDTTFPGSTVTRKKSDRKSGVRFVRKCVECERLSAERRRVRERASRNTPDAG